MARRTKKTRTGPRFQWLRNMHWGNIRRGAVAALWLAAFAGLIAATMYGVPQLEARAAAHAQDIEVEIEFLDPPAWFDGELREDIVSNAKMELRSDPFHRHDGAHGDLPAMRSYLSNTGWFDEVHQVRRARADFIIVDADFADPYALIRDAEGEHLIDSRGRLLPRTVPEGHMDQFTVVIGTRFARPARAGMEWEGSDVAAALRVMRLIDTQPWRDQVRRIEVTGQTRGGPIRLITNRMSQILWGSSPGEEIALEATPDRKLEFLNHNYTNFNHIDGNHRGEVDITDHRRVINR